MGGPAGRSPPAKKARVPPAVRLACSHVSNLTLGLGYLVVYMAIGQALASYPVARSIYGAVGLLLPAGAVVVAIVRRRREWAGCQRLFWDTIAIGMILWSIGHVGWAFGEIVLRRPTWLQWHTLFSLCGGAAPLIALVARPHRGVRLHLAARTALDIAGCGLLAAFFYTYFVMIPSVLPGSEAAAPVTLLLIAQALRFATLLAFVFTAIVARDTAWFRTLATLAVGVGIGFFLRIDTSRAILSGTYRTGTLYDLAWIVPFLCYAWAALQAPVSPTEGEATSTQRTFPIIASAVPLLLIPVIGYGWLQFASIGDAGDSIRSLLTSLLTVGGLGMLTLRLVAQGDALQRSDAKAKLLAAATEQTGDLILITRADALYEHANEAFLRTTGYSRTELAGQRFTDLIERGMEHLWDHIMTAVDERGMWRGTLIRRRRDGSTFPASCTVVALKDASNSVTHFVAVERDITEELQLRDQLVHTERLSAVGELVAGVAHEINNPLQTIVGCVELMLDSQKDAQMRRDLDVVRTEAARAGQIVRNLLAFVRRSAPDRVPADLNLIVRATVDMREYHLQQRDIVLTTKLRARVAPGARESRGDPANHPQPGAECRAGDRLVCRPRHNRHPHVRGRHVSVRRSQRRRSRHQPRAARPDLRAILQHERGGGGNRPRAVDLARHRQRARRIAGAVRQRSRSLLQAVTTRTH